MLANSRRGDLWSGEMLRPMHSIAMDEQIMQVLFSPYDWCPDVVCIASPEKIHVCSVDLSGKNCDDISDIDFSVIQVFDHPCRCQSLSLSPDTIVTSLPPILKLAVAGSDNKIRVFSNDADNYTCKEMTGHDDYINSICFDPESGLLASASDDLTARLWDTNSGQCKATYYLNSVGVSVLWHKDDPSKLLVAEKCGIVRFYNVNSNLPILSVNCGNSIYAVSWAPSEPHLLAILEQKDISVWDISKPSRPVFTKLVHTESGGDAKISHQGDFIATMSRLDSCIKILHVHSKEIWLNDSVTMPSNISWHSRLPLFCVGDDRRLRMWKRTPPKIVS